MNDALPLFGLAAGLCSAGFVIWVAGRLWLRAKELDRATDAPLTPGTASSITGLLAQIEARLGRLEQSVDATAIEVERLAEAQRFAARLLANADRAPAEGQ
jgi:hypothetical protein